MKGNASFLLLAALLAGCSSPSSPLPLTDLPPPDPVSSSVFAGHARAYRFASGNWTAAPEYDYDFIVLERRYADHREAIKELHRRHPKYDGRAGPRDQTIWFFMKATPAAEGGYDLVVKSSEGNGTGHETADGHGMVLELAYARRGWFVPFDTIRIRQHRAPGDGEIRETVELLSKRKGRDVPFMRMDEDGLVYRPVDQAAAAASRPD
jgi:hypothetical protein